MNVPSLPKMGRQSVVACTALVALLSTPWLSAQTNIDLRELSPGRGVVALGFGGVVGQPPLSPPFVPVAGKLGTATCWIDLNADGYDDLVFGAPELPFFPAGGESDLSGHVYVVFGGEGISLPSEPGDLDLELVTCSTVLDLAGGLDERFGASLANVGDVDGDGNDDLLVGAPYCGPNIIGAAYLIYGDPSLSSLPGTQPTNCHSFVVDMLGTQATHLVGFAEFGQFGTAVAGGDVNGDGLSDMLLGAPLASTDGLLQNGYVGVVYGQMGLPGTTTIDVGSLSAGEGTIISGADDLMLFGWSAAGVGNFDPTLPGGGENLAAGDDIVIGAPGATGSGGLFSGAAYLLRGLDAGSHALALDTDDFGNGAGSAGLVWSGENTGDQAGLFVGVPGDLIDAGDGFPELLIGAPLHDGLGRADSGALYLISGRRGTTNPVGFDLADIGSSGAVVDGLRLVGPVADSGSSGITGSAAGDLDGSGTPDLAVGLPGATVTQTAPSLGRAGTVTILDGAVVADPLDRTIDLAGVGAFRIMEVRGENAGALCGASLALGDLDADGNADLSIGAPGAPSDVHPLDPTNQAYTKTGRGHVLFGPLTRVGSLTPSTSFVDGPLIELDVFNMTDPGLAVVKVGANVAVIDEIVLGTPGRIVVVPPAPDVFGSTVDVTVETGGFELLLPDVFTYEQMVITSGPDPIEVVPGTEINFAGEALSFDLMTVPGAVTVGGVAATVLSVDPEAGTMVISAPVGLPSFTTLDIEIQGLNGEATLADSVSYLPFIASELIPASGSQQSGIYFPTGSFEGTPTEQLTIDVISSTGMVPVDLVFELGTDELGYIEVPINMIAGDTVTLDLPHNQLGPQDVLVDLRITDPPDMMGDPDFTLVLEDAFTWLANDFTSHPGTASGGFADAPVFTVGGEFVPSGEILIVFEDSDPALVNFAFMFIGISLVEPPMPFKGGLLGVSTEFMADFSPVLANFPTPIGLATQLDSLLMPEGFSLYMQLVTQERVGMSVDYGFSDRLEATIRFP